MPFLAASAFISIGFLALPPHVEIGAMSAVAIDRKDRIYVLHRGPQPILQFDKNGKYVRAFGEGLFKIPHGLRIDRAGHLWTTDNGNHLLRKFSDKGRLLLTIGETGELRFRAPDDLVFATTGDIYVADSGNSRIARISADGKLLGAWGKNGKGTSEFATPHALAIDSRDRVYVADRNNHRVQVFDARGNFLAAWTGFGNPFGVHVIGNELLVSDGDAHRMSHLSLDSGETLAQWGDASTLQLPHLMATDSKGRLYVAEVNGKRVQILRPVKPSDTSLRRE